MKRFFFPPLQNRKQSSSADSWKFFSFNDLCRNGKAKNRTHKKGPVCTSNRFSERISLYNNRTEVITGMSSAVSWEIKKSAWCSTEQRLLKLGNSLFGTTHPTGRHTFFHVRLFPYRRAFALPALSSEVSRKPSLTSLITNSSHFSPTNTKFSPTAQFNSLSAFRKRPPPMTLPLSLPIALSCLRSTFARRTIGRNLEAHDRNIIKKNNNNNLLQFGCHPVAVVMLHVYKTWNWLLLNNLRRLSLLILGLARSISRIYSACLLS